MEPKTSSWVVLLSFSLLAGLLGSFLFYSFVPFDWFSSAKPSFGTTITTINGSDTISGSRTTINNNFSSLNTNKFELSDWYATTSIPQITNAANLVTVGALNSGSLTTGFTVVGATIGGTGQTTVTAGDILYGSASNVWSKLPKGNNGDFLTLSAGLPVWATSVINQAANYLWSGIHNFTGSATYIKSLTASTTVSFDNGGSSFSYIFTNPGSHASSTQWMFDASGNVFERYPQDRVFDLNSNDNLSTSNTSTTTLKTITFPANSLLGTYKQVRITAIYSQINVNNTCRAGMSFGNGSASTTFAFANLNRDFVSQINGTIFATSSASEIATARAARLGTSFTGSGVQVWDGMGWASVDLTAQSYLSLEAMCVNASDQAVLSSHSVELLSQ